MTYSIGEAARATGKSRSAMLRAIRTGKVSAEKNAIGQWVVEPAELHRVYPEAAWADDGGEAADAAGSEAARHRLDLAGERLAAARAENEHLKGTIARLEEQIDDLKDQRTQLRADVEAWRAMAAQKRLTWRGLFGGGQAE